MAKVYSSINDFVLFPRDQSYMGTVDPRLGDNLNNMHYQQNAVSNMLRHGDISGQASTSYESYPPVSAYSSATSAYFGAHNMPYETRKGNMGRPMRGQTPSGSPRPQSHKPSTILLQHCHPLRVLPLKAMTHQPMARPMQARRMFCHMMTSGLVHFMGWALRREL